MPHEPTSQVGFRLTDRLIARLDRLARRLSKENPGLHFTRTDVVRDLLARALDVSEQDGTA